MLAKTVDQMLIEISLKEEEEEEQGERKKNRKERKSISLIKFFEAQMLTRLVLNVTLISGGLRLDDLPALLKSSHIS
ncbi:hypothetical protein M0804_012022 [Polistes exclamans]|nr:hypothetical protein M0804_012022 [Polistes exclamans]